MRLNCAWLLALARRLLRVLRPHVIQQIKRALCGNAPLDKKSRGASRLIARKRSRHVPRMTPWYLSQGILFQIYTWRFRGSSVSSFPNTLPPPLTTQLLQESAGTCPVCTSLGGTGSTTAVAVTSVRAAGGSLGASPCCCGACVTQASWCCRASN
jgi:hypothetical protein